MITENQTEEKNELGQTFAEAIEVIEPQNVLATIKASQLIDVSSWKEKQEKLVRENSFFEIVDNKTYELGKVRRTNVVKGRTELEKQDKLVASKFASIRKEVGTETANLVLISKPLEDEWQVAVKAWEDRKEREKEEAAKAEELRIKTIKDKIDEIETACFDVIQKTVYDEILYSGTQLDAFFKIEFDFEEYDILLDQVKDRITIAYENKVKSLTESENQRLENERMKQEIFNVRVIRFKEFGFELEDDIIFRSVELPHTYTKNELLNIDSATFERAILNLRKAKEEIEQSKIDSEVQRISELQASRLTEILPYVAFGEAVDLTKLSELSDNEYQSVLLAKKCLFDADLNNKQKAEADALAKLEEEKEAIYEIRKKRLEELGMKYSDEHDTLWLEEESEYILLKEDVSDYSALEFEETFSEVKHIIQVAKEKVEKDKVFEIRKNRMVEIGFTFEEQVEVFMHSNLFSGISKESIYECGAIDFETIITDAKLAIEKAKSDAEEAEKQKEIDDKLAKKDAVKLKKERTAIVKKYVSDKKALTDFVDSLEFSGAVPEMENEDSELKLNSVIDALEDFKRVWIDDIKNL